ncbi:MAG TPA: TolC family protein [Chthoniobacterales bacterium]|nr:TolC family protein [Chthoniobacterales bacterium]
MKPWWGLSQGVVQTSFIVVAESLVIVGIAFARDEPPPSPVRPWAPRALPRYEGELRQYQPTEAERRYLPAIDPRKTYNLAELIDIAQRSNPETHVAWERARQAAAAVGLTESAYYPYLVAAAAGGYDRAFIPFPTLRVKQQTPPTNGNLPNVEIVGGGTLITESLLARAELNAKWLLLDFGERKATRAAARERLMMANVGFNGTHQKIVFDVTDRFYQLGNARQKVMVTQSALDAAKTVEQAAQARFDNGLATKPELLQAQQQSAQSNFDVQASLGVESDARVALIESIGLLPTVSLKVADLPEKGHLDAQTADSVGELITKALSQRPDLVAKLANVRAKEQGILQIRAEYYPKVTLDAHVSETELDVSVANSDFFGGARPTFGAFLTMNVPIFDGFARRYKLDMAEADLHQAENELAGARDSAARDVWKAYTGYRTALKKQDAAEKLVTASKSAFDAVLDSYKQGLSTYTEVVTAERNLTAALATSHDTQAAIYTTQATLALSVGDLARPAPPLVRKPRR